MALEPERDFFFGLLVRSSEKGDGVGVIFVRVVDGEVILFERGVLTEVGKKLFGIRISLLFIFLKTLIISLLPFIRGVV